MTQPDRAQLVVFAGDSIARGSKSFALASKLFDPLTRERAWLLYAWCRAADDIADGQVMGHGMARVEDAPARVEHIRALTAAALAGEATGEPAFDAFGLVAAECAIPPRYAFDLVEGFQLDAAEWRPRSTDDLLRYCYHVAGAVGCMMAIVMGVAPDDEATLDRACDLGLAFQLANIARDLAEDDAAGRCYLPTEWLAEADIAPGEALKPYNRAKLAILQRRLAAMAEAYEVSARMGAAALPFRSAWAVLAAARIYGGIAKKVARDPAAAAAGRVVTTKRQKLVAVARAWVEARGRSRRAQTPRAPDLWTRFRAP